MKFSELSNLKCFVEKGFRISDFFDSRNSTLGLTIRPFERLFLASGRQPVERFRAAGCELLEPAKGTSSYCASRDDLDAYFKSEVLSLRTF